MYMDLIKEFENLGIHKIDLNSSNLLKILIDNDKKDLYKFFKLSAYDYDNIKKIIDKSNNENELLFLIEYDDYSKVPWKKEIFEYLLQKKYFTVASRFTYYINNDEEYFNIFLKYIKDYNISDNFICNVFKNIKNKNLLLTTLNECKRFDLIAFLIFNNYTHFKDIELLKLIDIKETIKYINAFDLKIAINLFKNNISIFDLFFLNGYAKAIECGKYFGYDFIIQHINENEDIITQVLEYAKYEDNDFYSCLNRYSNILKRPELLKTMFETKKYEFLEIMHASAWNLDLELEYVKQKNDNNLPKLNTSYYPLLNYYYNYEYSKSYTSIQSPPNIFDIKNIADLNICLGIEQDVKNGKIKEDSNLIRLYLFLAHNKSKNICKLAYALLDKDINNANKLIDESGITPYFREFLNYDIDYIKNSEINLDNIKDITYASFLKIILLDPNMPKYMHILTINQFNVDKYINNNTLTRQAIDLLFKNDGIKALDILLSNNYNLDLSYLETKIIHKYIEIPTQNQKDTFLNYCLERMDTIKPEQIDYIYELIVKVNNSNSYELEAQADKIISKLVGMDNCLNIFDKLEYIMTEGTTPEFFKRFAMYKLLYGDKDITKDDNVTSPILKSVSREEADKIILSDLFRVSLATNSKDIEHYLKLIMQGEELYKKIDKEKYLSGNIKLTEEEKYLLQEYRKKIDFLSEYLLKLDYEQVTDDYLTLYNFEKAFQRKIKIEFPFDYHLPMMYDSILSEITSEFKSVHLLLTYMGSHQVIKTALEEARVYKKQPLTIKKGDFIKGIDSNYLDNILNYGSLCIEMLGESASEDCTHLDTDMSLIDKDVENIPELLQLGLTGCNFGDARLIISRDYMNLYGDYILTKDGDNIIPFSEEDKTKFEIFCHSKNNNHYCIRTGFPMTYVKGIIARTNFDRIRFIISKNSFFIPVYDTNGKEIYSFEDYTRDRKKLSGLCYYGLPNYTLSNLLIYDDIKKITLENQSDIEKTNIKRNTIYQKLNEVFIKYFSDIKYQISNSVKKGSIEIIDTGSTGRNTNVAGDGDFDFIIRVDKEFKNSDKFKSFSSDIYKLFNKPVGDSKRIRLDDVTLDGITEPLTIELTIIDKNSKIDYTTDMCIIDRLTTIKKLYPNEYPYVKANIIFAKKFFKDLKIYKTYDGGLGGVGVENFILQNGGSFLEAMINFVKCAENSENLNDFKKKYHIYDYGKNHFSYTKDNYKKVSFPYDDYILSLNQASYEKMILAFKEYIEAHQELINSNSKK